VIFLASEPSETANKTDKSKKKEFVFGRKVLTDEKLAQFCFRSIFNPTHHSLPFRLDFLADRSALVGQRCQGKLGWSNLSIPCQKLRVSTKIPSQTLLCMQTETKKITKKSFRPS
jgi:hypothetical protein